MYNSYIFRFVDNNEEYLSILTDVNSDTNPKYGLIKTGKNELNDYGDLFLLGLEFDTELIFYALEKYMGDNKDGKYYFLMNAVPVNNNIYEFQHFTSITIRNMIESLEALEEITDKSDLTFEGLDSIIDGEFIDTVYVLIISVVTLDKLGILDAMINNVPPVMKYKETINVVREHWKKLVNKILEKD